MKFDKVRVNFLGDIKAEYNFTDDARETFEKIKAIAEKHGVGTQVEVTGIDGSVFIAFRYNGEKFDIVSKQQVNEQAD